MQFNEAKIKQIIQQDDPEQTTKIAQELGEQLARSGLTNSQIRNVFGTARQIEARRQAAYLEGSDRSQTERAATRREFILLKPKLVYQAARHNKTGLNTLEEWLSAAIDAATEPVASQDEEDARFQRFMEFFEAVLAYHYAAEHAQQSSNRGGRR